MDKTAQNVNIVEEVLFFQGTYNIKTINSLSVCQFDSGMLAEGKGHETDVIRKVLASVDGSGLPITRAASANQNVTYNTPREKPKEWPPCFPQRLKAQHQGERLVDSEQNLVVMTGRVTLIIAFIPLISTFPRP